MLKKHHYQYDYCVYFSYLLGSPNTIQPFTITSQGRQNVVISAQGFCGNQYTLTRQVRSGKVL